MLRAAEFGTNHLYPTSDGKPMAETDHHREQMLSLIDVLTRRYETDPDVYVTGNLLLFHEKGDRRKHVSPDCFVAFGVPKKKRINYLLWEEKPPAVVFELTSSSTKSEDTKKKFALYRDVLKAKEYFLFDPFGDYLDPPLCGYRLRAGVYNEIRAVAGRLPSLQLGLHLERHGQQLRLWDPRTKEWLRTAEELMHIEHDRAEAEKARAELALAENERLRELLRRNGLLP